jgi:hypothetical protein
MEALDYLIRDGLRAAVEGKAPSAGARRRLLRRAAEQLHRNRRWLWALAPVVPGQPGAWVAGFAWAQLHHINIQLAVRTVAFSYHQLR